MNRIGAYWDGKNDEENKDTLIELVVCWFYRIMSCDRKQQGCCGISGGMKENWGYVLIIMFMYHTPSLYVYVSYSSIITTLLM